MPTFDIGAGYATSSYGSPLTGSITVGNNPNRVMYAIVSQRASSGLGAGTCTFNSVSATNIGSYDDQYGNTIYIFRLINPASGTATFSWSTGSASGFGVAVRVGFWYDVNQSTPNRTLSRNNGSSGGQSSISVSATSVSGDLVLCLYGSADYDASSGLSITALGAGQTDRGSAGGSGTFALAAISEKTASSSSTSLSVTGNYYKNIVGLALIYQAPVSLPSVDTLAATDIEVTAAVLNGEVLDTGGADVTSRGFVYGLSSESNPGNVPPGSTGYDSYTSESGTFGTGVFDLSISSLTAETTYYVRAFAQNSEGYTYGDEVSFSSLPIPYAISGTVTLSGVPVEGAIVRCIRQSDNFALPDVETDSSGNYIFEELDEEELYHIAVEYTSGDLKYNAKSLWDVAPVEVE